MCELLMSFSQFATWAILPFCLFAVGSSPQLPVAGFSSFSCCNFHKFLELCMCLSTCLWLCVCVCVHFNNIYLANVAFQMQQQQQLHIRVFTARAASQTRVENWEMDTTKSECGFNFTERICLLCAHIVYATYRQIRTYILYRTGGYRYSQNMFGHNIRLTAAAALTTRGMPI